MSLIKWQPFGEFDEAFNRLMPGLFSRFRAHWRPRSSGKFEWAPSADISETDEEYLIRAELPAVKKEDVKVTLDQGMITIQRRTQGREGDQGREVPSRREFPRSVLAQLLGARQHRRQGHPRRIEGWCVDGSSAQDQGGDAEDRRSEGSVVALEEGVGWWSGAFEDGSHEQSHQSQDCRRESRARERALKDGDIKRAPSRPAPSRVARASAARRAAAQQFRSDAQLRLHRAARSARR